MSKKTNKRIKSEKYYSEDQIEIKRFIVILVVIIIFVLGIYFFTRLFVTKDLFTKKENEKVVTPGEIDYSSTLIGSIFNKPVDEYYVMIYDSSKPNSVYYTGIVNNYSNNTDALPVYYADLSNELNKAYIASTTNISNDLASFKVSGPTLLKIKKGKITDSYTTDEEMAKPMKHIEDEEN